MLTDQQLQAGITGKHRHLAHRYETMWLHHLVAECLPLLSVRQLCCMTVCQQEDCNYVQSSGRSNNCCYSWELMNVMIFWDICNNCNVIWKYLWFLLVTKSQVPLILLCFISSFITERNAKSQFKVRENTDLLFPFKLIESPELQVHGPQVWTLPLEPSFISAASQLKRKIHRRQYRERLYVPGQKIAHIMSTHITLERI